MTVNSPPSPPVSVPAPVSVSVKEIDPTTPPIATKSANNVPSKKNIVEADNVKIVEIAGPSSSRGPPKQ